MNYFRPLETLFLTFLKVEGQVWRRPVREPRAAAALTSQPAREHSRKALTYHSRESAHVSRASDPEVLTHHLRESGHSGAVCDVRCIVCCVFLLLLVGFCVLCSVS